MEEKDNEQDYDFRKVDNIRVIGRFRPSVEEEKREEKLQGITDDEPQFTNKQEVVLSRSDTGNQPFKCTLDQIFKSSATQKHVFNAVGRPMVQAVLEGYNATIFAYGQTGSGKTFTMFGPEKRKNETELGLVQRCCSYLFEKLSKRIGQGANDEIRAWQVSAEFVQIYKEHLSDLLEPSKAQRLNIRTNFQTDTPYVENLKSVSVENINDLLIALSQAHSNRVVASHKLNAASSRSHMLLILTLEQQMSDGSVKRSKLNFGDLAGSEDIAKALGPKPDPERMREAIAINSSLTALTTAIANLVKSQRPSYRSSSLTHILQESLGGNSKTTMIVACSPHFVNRAETIRTLRFATQAKQVKNKARVNKEETRAQLLRRIAELEALNQKLKTRVIELETSLKENGFEVEITAELYEDRARSMTVATDDNEDETSKPNENQPKKLIVKKVGGNTTNLSMDSPVTVGVDSQHQPIDLTVQVGIAPQYQRFSVAHSIPALLKQIEELQQQVNNSISENKEMNEKNRQLTTEVESLDSQVQLLREQNEQANKNQQLFQKERQSFEERIAQLTKELESSKNAAIKQQQDLDNQIQRQRNNLQTQIEEKKELQKQVKDLSLQNDELIKQNAQINAQLFYMKKHGAKLEADKQADFAIQEVEIQMEAEEKEFSPSELILHRFAATEVNDVRMSPDERMKKTCSMMSELSTDINSLMEQWLPKNKVRSDRMRSKTLVFQVRQLIGHFNVLVNQMKAQEEASQSDLRLDIKRRDAEIKRLNEENKKVLQLQDDIAEKDDLITQLNKEKDELKFEIEQLRNQAQQQQDMIHDVQSQVRFLSEELGRNRSTINALQGINPKDLFLPSPNNKNGSNSLQNMNSNDLQILSDEMDNESGLEDEETRDNNVSIDLKQKSSIQQWRDNLNVGDQLDAQDDSGLWWTAEIKAIRDDGHVQVSYDGWGEDYNEWLPRDSNRLEMYHSRYVTMSGDKKIIKQSSMQFEGKMFKTWRKRYFILYDNGQLIYYANQGDENALGSINVLKLKQVSKMSYGKNKQYGFEIEVEGNRIWKFICDEEKDQNEWINGIKLLQNEKSTN